MIRKIKKVLYRSFETKEISYKRLKEILQKDKKAILLDVRSKQEFEEGHLNGAVNIPLYELEKQIKNICNNTTIITCCASGYRSKVAKEKLNELGYKNVYNLKEGLDGI